MPEFETTRRVRHTAENMFDLVADVENYPKFLPLCQAARLRGKKVVSPSCDVIVADMTVAYKVIRESFTSRAKLNRGDMTIEVEYLDGPFKYLHNRWKFDDLPEHNCDVAFFHQLRVPLAHAERGDGRRLRQGVPDVRNGLREPRRRTLRHP